jgi:PPOX class probable F420-dependent enzyme
VAPHAKELEDKILELLDEHEVMTVATLRSDGWPQATMVGYARDGLTLYFAAAASSQKVANIDRDGRVSVALGHEEPTRLRGLSIAANAEVVHDFAEIDLVSELLREHYHEQTRFSPRETSSVLVRATPAIISIIDLGKGPGEPELVDVVDSGSVHTIESHNRSGAARSVTVHVARSYMGGYRPGAPP